jgi:hypothetical protein
MNSMEAYQYERGRYDLYRATQTQRMQCAPTPAARERVWQEGEEIRARMDQLADQVRAEQRNARPYPSRAATARRYDAAICAVRCAVFPSGVWLLQPAAPPEHAAELARVERDWSRAGDERQRAEVADRAEWLAAATTGRNATPKAPPPSVEDRYHAATAYVHRAIAAITPSIIEFWERPAFETKTAPYRNELQRIEARWSQAKNAEERAAVAHDAELLADHTQETMPGAPQDRQRTNLWKGETPQHAPATSFGKELGNTLTHTQPSSAVPVTSDDGTSWKKYAAAAALGAGGLLALRALLK